MPAAPAGALVAVVLGGLWLALWRGRWRYWGAIGVAAGVAIAAAARGPDLLASEDGRLFAVRTGQGGLALSSASRRPFEADNWLRRAGEAEAAPWPPERMACDLLGCIHAPEGGPRVALVRDARALAEDCAVSAVVVSAVPVRGACSAPLVIDRFALWRNGAHALRFDGADTADVTHVRGVRGARPWAPPPDFQ